MYLFNSFYHILQPYDANSTRHINHESANLLTCTNAEYQFNSSTFFVNPHMSSHRNPEPVQCDHPNTYNLFNIEYLSQTFLRLLAFRLEIHGNPESVNMHLKTIQAQ